MDNRPIDFSALRMTAAAKDYDRIMSKIKKLQDTIRKDIETSQDKPETYVYKRAVTSYEFNTSCLERAEQTLQKRKDYLRQKYEEDLLKAEEENEKDVLKYRKSIESATMTMEEEKKKKKSKVVVHAEYDIAELQKQLNKLQLPRMGDPDPCQVLPTKVEKKPVQVEEVQEEVKVQVEQKQKPSCPCGGKCGKIFMMNDKTAYPKCLFTASEIDGINRRKQEAREEARALRDEEEKKENARMVYMQERQKQMAIEQAKEDEIRRQELAHREELEEMEREVEEELKAIAENKARKNSTQTPLTQYNQLPAPDTNRSIRKQLPTKAVKKVGVGNILYRPPIEVQ